MKKNLIKEKLFLSACLTFTSANLVAEPLRIVKGSFDGEGSVLKLATESGVKSLRVWALYELEFPQKEFQLNADCRELTVADSETSDQEPVRYALQRTQSVLGTARIKWKFKDNAEPLSEKIVESEELNVVTHSHEEWLHESCDSKKFKNYVPNVSHLAIYHKAFWPSEFQAPFNGFAVPLLLNTFFHSDGQFSGIAFFDRNFKFSRNAISQKVELNEEEVADSMLSENLRLLNGNRFLGEVSLLTR